MGVAVTLAVSRLLHHCSVASFNGRAALLNVQRFLPLCPGQTEASDKAGIPCEAALKRILSLGDCAPLRRVPGGERVARGRSAAGEGLLVYINTALRPALRLHNTPLLLSIHSLQYHHGSSTQAHFQQASA